ncbi:3,4-dioxygenase subunit beta [Kocuria salsicia]|uniref:3,4-dioxygenase subunit beta n=1 Tax=Kocuria salsicia TaxID=664639 RepID=A0ABV3KDL7_9MICC
MTPIFPRRSIRAYPAASEAPRVRNDTGDAAPGAQGTTSPADSARSDQQGTGQQAGTTHEQPTFEGRPLDRPEEDVEDQGLAFDLGTLIDRRRALGIFGAGASVFALAACTGTTTSGSSGSASATASASETASATPSPSKTYDEEMPQETAGPYPGDGSNGADALDVSGVERSNITASIDGGAAVDGVAMTLTMNIVDMVKDNGPMTGAAVYVWHCDPDGNYSMYSEGVEDETYLRGVQVVGDDGKVTFTSIVPGCYAGRWPHIHFEVFPDIGSITDATNAVLTSQIALPEEMANTVYKDSRYPDSATNMSQITLETDNVFSDGVDMQMPKVSGSVAKGYTVTIDVPVDTSTEPTAAAAPGGAGGPGRAPGQ